MVLRVRPLKKNIMCSYLSIYLSCSEGFNLGSLFGAPQQPQVVQPQVVQPHPAVHQVHPAAQPVVHQAQPAFHQPQPAFHQPQPTFHQPQPAFHQPQPVRHQPQPQQNRGFLPSVDHSQPQNLLAFAGLAGAAGLAIHNANNGNGEVSIRPNVGLAYDPRTGSFVPSVTGAIQVRRHTIFTSLILIKSVLINFKNKGWKGYWIIHLQRRRSSARGRDCPHRRLFHQRRRRCRRQPHSRCQLRLCHQGR